MVRVTSPKQYSEFVRLVTSGLLTLQTTIAGSVGTELLLTTPTLIGTGAAQAQTVGRGEQIIKKVAPTVVYVEVDGGDRSGSGIIVDAQGLILTNAHVVAGAKTVKVELFDGRSLKAEVVTLGDADCLDLAVLRVPNPGNLTAISLAANGAARQGQDVFAIGHPHGIRPATITSGIISMVQPGAWRLLHNAAINGGNSGGALVNNRGELIGINTSKIRDAEGMAIAITVETARSYLQALRQGVSPAIGRVLIPGHTQSNNALAQTVTLSAKGVELTGQLQQNDSLMCGDYSYADVYTFQGKADQPIRIDLVSQQIKPFLVLLAPSDRVIAEMEGQG
ncbi:MAG: trypsin-like peptidase domain-containing protein [Leptolyngbyaceae cyanobacterium bins.349]|nr:trypsin-like peptidase domain-containing protein [Leptolyngbyaceae cyanobacterium bins.349]